jgi:hypothetical protein
MSDNNIPDTTPTGVNQFGGKNERSLYVPLTEDEQEVLSRLVEARDLEIVIHGWGIVQNPTITFGDKRVCLPFRVSFNAPAQPRVVHFFDLELRTLAGISLMKQRYPLNPPTGVMIGAGVYLDLVWDISIDHMSPELVKAIKPGAIGLTTRRLDRETGERTLRGNMKPSATQELLLHTMDSGSARIRVDDQRAAVKATLAEGHEVKADGGVILAPEVK